MFLSLTRLGSRSKCSRLLDGSAQQTISIHTSYFLFGGYHPCSFGGRFFSDGGGSQSLEDNLGACRTHFSTGRTESDFVAQASLVPYSCYTFEHA